MNIEEAASLIGINVTSEDFWNSCLDIIVKDIELFLDLTK